MPPIAASGLPYWGATAGNLFALQIDTVLVVSLMSTEAAGIYAVASAFGNAQFSLGDALGITSFGVLSNEKNIGNQKQILTETFRQSALLSAVLALLLSCLIPFIVTPLFGSAFFQATRPAVILAVAAALTASEQHFESRIARRGASLCGTCEPIAGNGGVAAGRGAVLETIWAGGNGLGGCSQRRHANQRAGRLSG